MIVQIKNSNICSLLALGNQKPQSNGCCPSLLDSFGKDPLRICEPRKTAKKSYY
jgi:hypothetical protein